MKIIFFVLAIFCPFLSCDSNRTPEINSKVSDQRHVEYYSTIPLRESPFPRLQGVIRLNKRTAMKRNHYKFVFDSEFRLQSISFNNGNLPINPNHTANYFFTSHEQRFEYQTSREIRTFYDRYGNPVKQRKAFKEIYSKDQNGRYTHLHFLDEYGNRIENSWGIYEYKWEVQNDGTVIEERVDQAGKKVSLRPGFDFWTIRLCYGQDGFLSLMQNIDDDGNLLENSSGAAQDQLHFDEMGRWFGWTVLDRDGNVKRGNGPNVARGVNQSNSFGYEKSILFEDVDGSVISNSHGFFGSIRNYDKYGNFSLTNFVDEEGKPARNAKSGYCYAKYYWDDNGINRTMVELLDVDKKLIPHKTRGYAKIKQEYDSLNRLIKTAYLGVEENLINRLDNGISYIIYNYDKKNKLIGTNRFDKDGNNIE